MRCAPLSGELNIGGSTVDKLFVCDKAIITVSSPAGGGSVFHVVGDVALVSQTENIRCGDETTSRYEINSPTIFTIVSLDGDWTVFGDPQYGNSRRTDGTTGNQEGDQPAEDAAD